MLKPGGRLAISDVVALAEIPAHLRKDWELYTGCVSGASTIAEIKAWLAQAGFTQIRIEPKDGSREIIGGWFPGRRIEEFLGSATIETRTAMAVLAADNAVAVLAGKPAITAVVGR